MPSNGEYRFVMDAIRFELDAFLFIAAVLQTIRYKGRECLRAHQRDLRYVERVHEWFRRPTGKYPEARCSLARGLLFRIRSIYALLTCDRKAEPLRLNAAKGTMHEQRYAVFGIHISRDGD